MLKNVRDKEMTVVGSMNTSEINLHGPDDVRYVEWINGQEIKVAMKKEVGGYEEKHRLSLLR